MLFITELSKPSTESVSLDKCSINTYESQHKRGVCCSKKSQLDKVITVILGKSQVSVGFWNTSRICLVGSGQAEGENSRRKKE